MSGCFGSESRFQCTASCVLYKQLSPVVIIAEASKLAVKYLMSLPTDACCGVLLIFCHGNSRGDEDYNSCLYSYFLRKAVSHRVPQYWFITSKNLTPFAPDWPFGLYRLSHSSDQFHRNIFHLSFLLSFLQ